MDRQLVGEMQAGADGLVSWTLDRAATTALRASRKGAA